MHNSAVLLGLVLLMAVGTSAAHVKTSSVPNNSMKDPNFSKLLQDLNVTKIFQDLKAKVEADVQAKAAQKLNVTLGSPANDNSSHTSIVIGSKTIVFKKPTAPRGYNSSIPALAVNSVFSMVQDVVQAQPLIQLLGGIFNKPANSSATGTVRSLLANEAMLDPHIFQFDLGRTLLSTNDSDNSTSGPTVSPTATTLTQTEIDAIRRTNGQKIGSFINYVFSDSWLVLYSAFNVARAGIQLLGALVKATATGSLTIDGALILTFADLAASFTANVNYLLYSTQKALADIIAPKGLVKLPASPRPSP